MPVGAPMQLGNPGVSLPAHPLSGFEPSNGANGQAAYVPGQAPLPHALAHLPQLGPQLAPQLGPQLAPPTAQIVPPPYLASQTAARMTSPEEPWAETLKTLMLAFGVILVAAFVLPWRVMPTAAFSWDAIRGATASTAKLLPLLIGGTGVLAVLLSLLPLSVSARGVAAAFLGLVPLGLNTLLLGEIHLQALLGLLALLTLIPGLILRSEYQSALVARIMVSIGVACVLVPMLVPDDGTLPLVATFKAISTAPGRAKILPIVQLGWLALTLLALLAWLPAPGSAGTKVLAWVLLAKPLLDPLISFLATTPGSAMGNALKQGLFPHLWLPIVITAWYVLTGYGTASVVGKSLEHT